CGQIRNLPKPVAVAVRGHCLGGALEMAVAADFRVCAPDARFGMPEVTVGLPSVIDAALLMQYIGVGRAKEMLRTGEPIGAEQAYTTRASRELCRSGRLALVVDDIEMPGGGSHQNRWFRATSAAFIVPVFEDGSTMLVRQWRHPWGQTSWEVPAGTLEEGEDP